MPDIKCPIATCGYATGEVADAVAVALLNIHAMTHTAAAPPAAPSCGKGPKLERPKIALEASNEDWNAFCRRWTAYRKGSGIDNAAASGQLLECATEGLMNIVLRASPSFVSLPVDDALDVLKSFAVVPVALGVLRSDLASLRQDPDEPFRAYAARVQGKAETCEFKVSFSGNCAKCHTPFAGEVYYVDEVIRDVLLNGIADMDIRRDAMATENILRKSVNDLIAFIESRETARNANPSSAIQSLSSYRRSTKSAAATTISSKPNAQERRRSMPTASERSRTAPCPDCGTTFHLFTELRHGWNTKPHERCAACWRVWKNNHNHRNSSNTKCDRPTSNTISIAPDTFGQLSTIGIDQSHQQGHRHRSKPIILAHHAFTAGEWRRAKVKEHPRINLSLTPDFRYSQSSNVSALVDSGAQSNVWSMKAFLAAGYTRQDLSPVTMGAGAANKSRIHIQGAFFARVSAAAPTGKLIQCRAVVYVSEDVDDFFMSYETMIDLGIVGPDFPTVGSATSTSDVPVERNIMPNSSSRTSVNITRLLDDGCSGSKNGSSCGCPQRQLPPAPPTQFPFECIPENNQKMKQWLLTRYAGSTFNTCPHRPLPCMAGPAVEIHLDPNAQPRACHTPASIPLHWQQRVHEDLLRDEALGVIEKVPYGEPVIWCHRLVVTRKHDGTPRRTVDLSPLNKHCKRETHSSDSPFHSARRVPRDTWKTVTDAWNGFHSVPLRQSDRHLTTFITPFGLWRYTRAPQGFLSSGDGYNRRFDAVIAEFSRKERIVDDTIHFDSNLEEHWWRTIQFLNMVGSAGIVLNPDKFQFAQRDVDFAGFRITDTRIDPLPKFLAAIADFPTPTSTTDIRSWFGLVNQVANYAQLRNTMEPFRRFLSPKIRFEWSPELDSAFQLSKESILQMIRNGIEIFDLHKRTCLRPDWSTKGIGYFLLQQHCRCPSGLPDCCSNGWKIVLAGSRFLQSAEQRYAPIEGEALAVAWGLEQTRFFTQGCDKLLIVTDHKPLVKIFGDRTLDEITNTRLFRLKQRTLPWHFQIAHLPGKTNLAADAASRHPAPTRHDKTLDTSDQAELFHMTSIQQTAETMSISWEQIAQATRLDLGLNSLLQSIRQGLPDTDTIDPLIAPYWKYQDGLYESDSVILYKDRVVLPPSLRRGVLDLLHSAHQGTTSMLMRAKAIVIWPGMSRDIKATRAKCSDCNKIAPSQPHMPATHSVQPTSPFEAIFADYFSCGGTNYLVVGDRLSGWTSIFYAASGSSTSGAAGLTGCLRQVFATFGVPEELSSDGGPEFASGTTRKFLEKWGVHHRISSAHHPQSNGRAEVAVKAAKRLLRSHTGPCGTLDTDHFLKAMLQLRNTPDADCHLSPAEIIYGRPLRDSFLFAGKLQKFSDPDIRPAWREAWRAKESALRNRFHRTAETINLHSRPHSPLKLGDRCYVQNQSGNTPKRWDRSGTIVDIGDFDSYTVKIDGTGRLTRRNRQFLRRFVPASTIIQGPSPMQLQRPTADITTPRPIQTAENSSSADASGREEDDQEHPYPPTSMPPTPSYAPDHDPPSDSDSGSSALVSESEAPRRSQRQRRPPLRYSAATGEWL